MECPSCGSANQDGHRFCGNCGAPLPPVPAASMSKIGRMPNGERICAAIWRPSRRPIHHKRRGHNAHHVAEACFKALARALRMAAAPDPRVGDAIPSTKGAL